MDIHKIISIAFCMGGSRDTAAAKYPSYIDIVIYIYLLYFMWADQRVKPFYNTTLFEVGSYRTMAG